MPLDIGDRFRVAKIIEVKSARGAVVARFRPEFDYRVTSRNREQVEAMIAAGDAVRGGHAEQRQATAADTRLQRRLKPARARLRGCGRTGAPKQED